MRSMNYDDDVCIKDKVTEEVKRETTDEIQREWHNRKHGDVSIVGEIEEVTLSDKFKNKESKATNNLTEWRD